MTREEIIDSSFWHCRRLFEDAGIPIPAHEMLGFYENVTFAIEGQSIRARALAPSTCRDRVFDRVGEWYLPMPHDWHAAWIGGEVVPHPNYDGWQADQKVMHATFE